jgi:hypothetical protein
MSAFISAFIFNVCYLCHCRLFFLVKKPCTHPCYQTHLPLFVCARERLNQLDRSITPFDDTRRVVVLFTVLKSFDLDVYYSGYFLCLFWILSVFMLVFVLLDLVFILLDVNSSVICCTIIDVVSVFILNLGELKMIIT